MSISTELQSLNNNILGAYTAIQGKEGTVPENKNMENLPAAIESIPSGGGGGGIGIPREVNANGVYGIPTQSLSFSLPSNATDVSEYALNNAFRSCKSLTSVDLSSLTKVSGQYAFSNAFYECPNITSIDLSSLTNINYTNAFAYAFSGCTSITSVSFPSLSTVDGSNAFTGVFNGCTKLTSVSLPVLHTAKGGYAIANAFNSCPSLTSMSFPVLAVADGNKLFNHTFASCKNLTSVSFPALTASSFGSRTNQFENMLYACSNVTVHFPAAIQSVIGSWSDVTKGFGGTNTTVLFDL